MQGLGRYLCARVLFVTLGHGGLPWSSASPNPNYGCDELRARDEVASCDLPAASDAVGPDARLAAVSGLAQALQEAQIPELTITEFEVHKLDWVRG